MTDVRELMQDAFVDEPTSMVDAFAALETGRARNRTRRDRWFVGAVAVALVAGIGAVVAVPRFGSNAAPDRAASGSQQGTRAPGVPAPDSEGVIAYARGFTSAPADQATPTAVTRTEAARIADEQVARAPATFPPGYSLELRVVTEGNFDEPGVPRLTWVVTYPGSAPMAWGGPAHMSVDARAARMAARCSAVIMVDAESRAMADAMLGHVPGMMQFCEAGTSR